MELKQIIKSIQTQTIRVSCHRKQRTAETNLQKKPAEKKWKICIVQKNHTHIFFSQIKNE